MQIASLSLDCRSLAPRDLARVLELLLLERTVVVCSRRAALPSLFIDAARALLFPLDWTLPCVERLPAAQASDLLDGF